MIKLIKCPRGDWFVLLFNDEIFFEGHTIPDFVWISLINTYTNVTIQAHTISDDDMEMGKYIKQEAQK
jgi:hypothetical protein